MNGNQKVLKDNLTFIICKTGCLFFRLLSGSYGQPDTQRHLGRACHYLLDTKKRRPCKPSECNIEKLIAESSTLLPERFSVPPAISDEIALLGA